MDTSKDDDDDDEQLENLQRRRFKKYRHTDGSAIENDSLMNGKLSEIFTNGNVR